MLEDDFFIAGMNSLHAMNLLGMLRRSLSQAGRDVDPEKIPTSLIYSNPSLGLLSIAIQKLLDKRSFLIDEPESEDHAKDFDALVQKYLVKEPPLQIGRSTVPCNPVVVLLTGSAGSLGSYILDLLLDDPLVSRIYCLNRDESARKNQTESNTKRGLSTNFNKVSILVSDLAKELFSPSQDVYQEMLQSVNYIIRLSPQ